MVILAEVLNLQFVVVTSSPSTTNYVENITPPPPAPSSPPAPVSPTSSNTPANDDNTPTPAPDSVSIPTSAQTTPTPAIQKLCTSQEPTDDCASTPSSISSGSEDYPPTLATPTPDSTPASTPVPISSRNASADSARTESATIPSAAHAPKIIRLTNKCLWHYDAACLGEVTHFHLLLFFVNVSDFVLKYRTPRTRVSHFYHVS